MGMSETVTCPVPVSFESAGVTYETVAFKERDVEDGFLVLAYCPEADALYRGRFHRLFGFGQMRWDAPARYRGDDDYMNIWGWQRIAG